MKKPPRPLLGRPNPGPKWDNTHSSQFGPPNATLLTPWSVRTEHPQTTLWDHPGRAGSGRAPASCHRPHRFTAVDPGCHDRLFAAETVLSLGQALGKIPVTAHNISVTAHNISVIAHNISVIAHKIPVTAHKIPVTAQRTKKSRGPTARWTKGTDVRKRTTENKKNENKQDPTGRIEQTGSNRQDPTTRIQQAGANRQDRTSRIQQP